MRSFSRPNRKKALAAVSVSQREVLLLSKILSESSQKFDYVAERNIIVAQRKQLEKQKHQPNPNCTKICHRVSLPKPSYTARSLMTQPAVTTKDLSLFISTQYLVSQGSEYDMREKIHSALMDLISASTANNLRTVMQFLAIYWQIGINGIRPTIYDSRRQVEALLSRSLLVHPKTQFIGGGEQVGIPDFARFTQFVSTFHKYMGTSPQLDDYISDLLFILLSRSGNFEDATREIEQRGYHVSDESIRQYIETAKRRGISPEAQKALKSALLNESLGVYSTMFLVDCIDSNEFQILLDFIDQSSRCVEIYNDVQHLIVRAVCLKHQNWPLTVAVMERIRHNCALYPRSLMFGLEGALIAQNKNAVRLILDELDHFKSKPETTEYSRHMCIPGEPSMDVVRRARSYIG